jgi:hypothetical protein
MIDLLKRRSFHKDSAFTVIAASASDDLGIFAIQ